MVADVTTGTVFHPGIRSEAPSNLTHSGHSQGSGSSAGLTSSGHKLQRLRTLGHSLRPCSSGSLSSNARASVTEGSAAAADVNVDADAGSVDSTFASSERRRSGLDEYFAKIKSRRRGSENSVGSNTSTNRRLLLIKSNSTGTVTKIAMRQIGSSSRSSFLSKSKSPPLPLFSFVDDSVDTLRTEDNTGRSNRALNRTRSKSAISSLYSAAHTYRPKSAMTVRTLDESLGRAGPEADESLHRRRILRRLSFESGGREIAGTQLSSSLISLPGTGEMATLTNEDPNPNPMRRTVSFNDVRIRSYPITIGDNPSVSKGPAVTIDWDPIEVDGCMEQKVTVDEFEEHHPERRQVAEMRIPCNARKELLRNSGFSRNEIDKGLRDVNISKRQRNRTITMLHTANLEEKKDTVSRAVANALTSKKKQERELMERSILAERVAQKERAHAWAEEERLAAIELAEIEAIVNGETAKRPNTSVSSNTTGTICIHEDETTTPLNSTESKSVESNVTGDGSASASSGTFSFSTNSELRCKSDIAAVLELGKEAQFLSIGPIRRRFKEFPHSIKQEKTDALKDLKTLRNYISNDLANGGHEIDSLSRLDAAQLARTISRLLNNLGCFFYANKSRSAAVKVLCQALNVLIHMSRPEVAIHDDTPNFSDVSKSLRRVLMHLMQKNTLDSIGSRFTEDAANVLSNLLKTIVAKSRSNDDGYVVDPSCGLESACILFKTNAEFNIWLGRFQDSIANYEILEKLLEERLALSNIDTRDEIAIAEEIVEVLQKMRLIYHDILSDIPRASGCIRKIADHRKKLLCAKLKQKQKQQLAPY